MKRFFLIIILCFAVISGYSQMWKFRRYEVWSAFSVYQYYGDIGALADKHNLGGLTQISFTSNRPGISFGGIFRYDERFYIQASNSLGFFAKSDKDTKRNYTRDFAFRTITDELSIQGYYFFVKENEKNYFYSPFNYGRGRGIERYIRPFSFYVFAGVGGIFYKVTPKESLASSPRFVGNKHISVAFPIGLGAKFTVNPDFSLALELGRRFTLTDYLDGFTSVYSEHNDVYYILSFKAIYRLKKAKQIRYVF
ncbi:MAG: hypothetical protein HOO91_02405 [Bacteroidales bacterium]|nr:hypothetical protein [Bacteroidales bacterium]